MSYIPSRKICAQITGESKNYTSAALRLGISRQQLSRVIQRDFSPDLNDALDVGAVQTLPGSQWAPVSKDKDYSVPLLPVEEEILTPLQEHRLKRQIKDLRARVQGLLEEESHNVDFTDFVSNVVTANRVKPEWLLYPEPSLQSPAIATAMLSDLHFGEVINPHEIENVNSYDVSIAKDRLQRFFENTIRLARDYVSGVDIEGLVLLLGGDFLSGSIHDELTETNQISDYESVLELSSLLADGIITLADYFGQVHVKAVPGNHARNSRKPRAKKRAVNDLDWLTYHLSAKYVNDNLNGWVSVPPLVTFDISEGADLPYQIYDTRYLLTHGDQFRGGSGISGLMAPLMLGDHRKRKRQQSIGKPYDILVMGHWHQLMLGASGIIVNGSMCGYNEYAYTNNLVPEPPQQAFWLTDPEHGVTLRAPIHVG